MGRWTAAARGQNGQNGQNLPACLEFAQIAQFAQDEALRGSAERAAIAKHNAGTTEPAHATWGKAEEERAGIVEHNGYIPRVWAEGFARLDPERPPSDVPPERWQRFVDDVGLFLDSPFRALAAALGWGPFDLFGCDRDRPFARIDQAGLLWQLNGGHLIALSEDAAGIQTCAGARQTYRLGRSVAGQMLTWELIR